MADSKLDRPTEDRPPPDPEPGRTRPVKVPGSITGFVAPADDAPAATNGNGVIAPAPDGPEPVLPPDRSRWVRLRFPAGPPRPAPPRRGHRGDGPRDPAPGTPAGRRLPRPLVVMLGLAAGAAAIAAGVVALTGDGDDPSRPAAPAPAVIAPIRPLPPARTTVIPFAIVKGAHAGLAAGGLRNSGSRLALTLRTNVPYHPYAVYLVSSHAPPRRLLASPGGPRFKTVHMDWRTLARYRELAVYRIIPPAAAQRGAESKRGAHAKHGERAARTHRTRRPTKRQVLHLRVDRLVKASGVSLSG